MAGNGWNWKAIGAWSAALALTVATGCGDTSTTPPPAAPVENDAPPAEAAPTPEGEAAEAPEPAPAGEETGALPAGGSELTLVKATALAASAIAAAKDPQEVGDANLGAIGDRDYLWQPADESKIVDEPYTIEPPAGLPTPFPGINIPLANPMTKGKVELGKLLYFDPRLSLDGTVSCATCHNPEKGWTDNLPTSIGIEGQVGGRNAPTVLNTIYGRTMFWDGRAPSLEAQSQGPPQNPIEMGGQTYKQIVDRFRGIPEYQERFAKVFGTEVTLDGMAKAIAAFERAAALSGNSRYDKYNEGDLEALTESEKRGLVLFGLDLRPDDEFEANVEKKKANCTACHAGANFTDENFHNLGVGWDEATKTFKDLGRWAEVPIGAKMDKDLGAFKTPTLRDISKTAPYMHDGSEATLEEVMAYYNKGGNPNPYLSGDMKPLNLTEQEIADVVAFMKALDGEPRPVEVPKLPAGPDGTAPDARDALTPPGPKATTANADVRFNVLHGFAAGAGR